MSCHGPVPEVMDYALSHVVADVAAIVGTRVLLVGAYARDLCLGAAIAPTRATNADFAVLLESWEGEHVLDAAQPRVYVSSGDS